MDARTLPWEPQLRLPGRGAGQVFLLGGFGASPEPLRGLGERLRASGADVTIAALARHTGDDALFYSSRTWHYYAAAARELRALTSRPGAPLILGGYSTGALVSLLLAAARPANLAGVVLVSPALRTARSSTQLVGYSVGSVYYLGLPLAMLTAAFALVVRGRRRGAAASGTAMRVAATAAILASTALGLRNVTVPLKTGGPVERDGEWVTPPHFARASLVAGATLVPLQLAARRRMRHVTAPCCVVFGAEDDVVDVSYGVRASAALPQAEVHVVAGAPHRVVAHPECVELVTDFVARAVARATAPRAS